MLSLNQQIKTQVLTSIEEPTSSNCDPSPPPLDYRPALASSYALSPPPPRVGLASSCAPPPPPIAALN